MRKLWPILVLGIIIRIVLAFSTFHSDLQAFNLSGKIVASGNILNLYDFLPGLPNDDPIKHLAVLNYPPAIYFFHGAFNFLFSNILGLTFINSFLLDLSSNYGNILFNLHLLFLKLPYLIFDLLTGLLLYKFFNSEKQARIAFTLWMFNPVDLYTTYMMGQFDVIPTFFVVLSLYLIGRNKISWSALALGGGVAFKIFPIFFVIPLLILAKTLRKKIEILILIVLPYLLSVLPFIFSQGYRSTALFTSQNTKSLYAAIPVSGNESIILFPAALFFLYLVIWHRKYERFNYTLFLYPLLLFYIFTHFHSQWLLWVTPFLIVDLLLTNFKSVLPTILIFFTFVASLFFFDPSLTVNIFAPIFPGLKNLPSIWTLLHLNIDYNLSRSLIQTLLVSSMTFLIYENFKKRIDE